MSDEDCTAAAIARFLVGSPAGTTAASSDLVTLS
jgi:hypothetical protein